MANMPQMLPQVLNIRTLKAVRRRLIVSTALMGGVVGIANGAQAQVLPDPAGATVTTSGTTGGTPALNAPDFSYAPNGAGALTETISLRDNRTVIDWANRFSVAGGGYAVNFTDGRATVAGLSGLTDNIAVLNRDLSGMNSYIYGSVLSDPNVAVYLINTNGILIGNSAVINTGSFFASTNNIAGNADFLAGNALRFGTAGTGDLQVVGGAAITTTSTASTNGGRLGDLVLLGVSLNVGAVNLTATGGDVALVAADDVTVATGVGSPLALTINKGTAVSGAFNVSATIAGRNVTMALATRGSVADAVLNVGGIVTANGAAVTDHGIVLTSGVGGADVTLGVTPVAGGDIEPTGAVAVTGGLDSRGRIGINALTGASTTVAATADKGVAVVSDGSIGLAAITAGGPIAVSGSGTKAFNGTLRTTAAGANGLVSVDGSGGATFVAAQSIDAGGAVALGQTTLLGTLTAKQITAVDDVRVSSFGASDVGGVKAGTTARFTSTIGGVTLGGIDTGGNFDLVATNGNDAITGAATIGGDYTVQAGGLTLGSIGGTVLQQAVGAVSLTTYGSNLDALGTLTLQSGNASPLTLASAGSIGFGTGTVLLGGDARQSDVQIRSNSASGAVYLGRVDAHALLGAVAAAPFTNGITRTSQVVLGNVTLTDPLELSGSSVSVGKMIVTGGGATLFGTSGGVTAGAADLAGALFVNASAVATIGATGDSIKATSVDLTGTSLTTLGTIESAGLVKLHATMGDLSVTGPSTKGGNVTMIADAGNATVLGNVTSAADYSVTGSGVTLGTSALPPVVQQAVGAIAVHATGAAGITGNGALTLLSNSQPTYDFGGTRGITLTTDAGGIAAPTTSVLASTGKYSDVTIAATPASAGVSLGMVSARDLFGLNARAGAVALGDVTVANGLDVHTSSGNVSTGAVQAYSSVSLVTDAGTLLPGNLTSDEGFVTGKASGTLTAGAVSGKAGVELRGGGTVSAGNVTAANGAATLSSTSGMVGAGIVSAYGVTDIAGNAGVMLTSAANTFGDMTVTAANGGITATGDLDANGALKVTAFGAIGTANLRGASVFASGASVTAGAALGRATFVDITATGGDIALTSATASGANLKLTAPGGGIVLGTGSAYTGATLDAASDVRTDLVTANGGSLTVNAGGSITGRALGMAATDDRFDTAYGRADLIARDSVAAIAGTATTGPLANSLAQLGNVTHGAGQTGDVAAGRVDVRGATIALDTATARIGALSLVATGGPFALTIGKAGTTARLELQGSTGELVATSLTAGMKPLPAPVGDVTIRSGTSARLGTVSTATGGIDVAANGSITGLALATPILDGRSDPNYGRAILTGAGVLRTSAVSLIQLGTLSGSDICINGNATCSDPLLASPVVDIDGVVTATGKLFAGGSNVLLGASNAVEAMTAAGSVRLVAVGGTIGGGNGLTLQSDLGNTGAGLALDAGGAGGIVFASGSTLLGGASRSADIGIRLASAGAPLQLGTVQGRSLQSVDAAGVATGAISLAGPVTLGNVAVRNALSITTTGAIITGAVDVTDGTSGLKLDAGGTLTSTGALTAQGNLFLGSDGNLGFTTARSVGGTATVDVLGNATGASLRAAGAVSETVTGTDTIGSTISDAANVTVDAGHLTKTLASAGEAGTLFVIARTGALDLTTGTAGGGATLTTQTIGSTLTAGTLTAGTALAGGDATVTTAGDARLGSVTSGALASSGNILVTAPHGSVTGLSIGPIFDGRLAPAFGRADLIAPGGNVTVVAGTIGVPGTTIAQLGSVAHGAGGTAKVSADAVDVAAATVDLDEAFARSLALRLHALGGALNLVTGMAGTTANVIKDGGLGTPTVGVTIGTLTANSLATIRSSTLAGLGSVTSTTDTVDVSATGAVTASTFSAGNDVSVVSTGSGVTIADAVTAGRDYIVTGQTVALGVDVGAETQKAARRVVITSKAGAITGGVGLTLQSNSGGVADAGNARTLNLDATGGGIAFDLTSTALGGTARQSIVGIGLRTDGTPLSLGTIRALSLSAVDPALTGYSVPLNTSGEIVLGDVLTTNTIDIGTSAGSIRAARVEATAGDVTLRATAASGQVTGLALTAAATDGRLVPAFGRADVFATAAGRNLTVAAGNIAQLGTGTAGQNVTVTAGAGIDATVLTGSGGTLTVTSLGGPVVLGAGTGGGDTSVTSATNARVGSLTSTGGSITLVANGGDATGLLGTPAGGIAPLYGRTTLTATGALRNIDVIATGLVQLGDVLAGQNVTVTANAGIDVTKATGTTGLLSLITQNESLLLGSGSAGTTALLDKRGTSGDLRLGTMPLSPLPATGLTSGGNATVTSATNARITIVTSTGGNVSVTTTGGDITGLSGATPLGELAPTFGRANLAAAGNLTVAASGLAQLGGGNAGQNVTVTANTGIDATQLTAAAGLLSAITQDQALLLASGSAGTTALLDKRGASGELRLGAVSSLPVAGLTSGGDASVSSATAARATFVASTGGNVSVTTTAGNLTGLLGASPPGELASTFGRANLTAGGNIVVTSSGLAQLGTGQAGQALTVNAGAGIDATSLTASAGALSLMTLDGNLLLDTGAAGTTTTLDKRGTSGELRLAGSYAGTTQTAGLVSGGTATLTSSTSARLGVARGTGAAADVIVTANTGSVTGLSGVTPSGALAPSYGRATLLGGRDVTVTAGPVAQLATVTAGRNTAVGATAIDTTSASATAGSLSLAASGGVLTLGTGSAGTTATLTKTGAAGSGALTVSTALTSGTAAGSTGTATLASSTDARIAAITAQTGNVVVTATTGAITGISGAAPAGGLDPAYGRANLTASATNGSITVAAGAQAQLGAVSAGAGTKITAGAIDATSLNATTGAMDVTASTGAVTVSGAITSGTSTTIKAATRASLQQVTAGGALDVTASSGDITASGAIRSGTTTKLTAGSKVSIQQANAGQEFTLIAPDAELGNTLTAPSATVIVTGAAANLLRLGGNSVPDTGFELTAAELNRIAAANLTFNADTRAVEIKAVALGAGVGSSRIDVLTTGAIKVTGALNAPTTGRTIRLGGTTATNRAASLQIVTSADVTSGGSITADTLDLRADRIIAGQPSLITKLGAIGGTDEINTITARFTANPQSQLYDAGADGGARYTGTANAGSATTGIAPVFLTANVLKLTYGPYALFQNTGVNGDTAGVNVGQLTGPSVTLTSTGATAANAFALFGRIGTVTGPVATGRSAALLGPGSIETSNAGATDPRINPNNSRINGCLIGSGGGGCLITLVSTPRPVPFDLGQTSILTSATDLALAFDPLVGTSNEALFSDLGSIDLFSNEEQPCPPGSTADTCPKPGAPK